MKFQRLKHRGIQPHRQYIIIPKADYYPSTPLCSPLLYKGQLISKGVAALRHSDNVVSLVPCVVRLPAAPVWSRLAALGTPLAQARLRDD